jgi:hypothetical protein
MVTWVFHGNRLYPFIDIALKTIQTQIVASGGRFYLTLRTGDGINNIVDYEYGPPVPGVYQVTIKNYRFLPDNPQIPFVKFFAIRKPATAYIAPPPPSVNDASYKGYLAYTKAVDGANSTTRT